jgi:hypothetical protein
MKFRQIGLPVVVSSLMGFVFMGPQPAASQAPAPRAESLAAPATSPQDPLVQVTPNPYGGANYGDPELNKLHGEEAQIEGKVHELLTQYGRTEKEGDKAAIKKNLTAQLEKQFDLQQKRRDLEVTRVEAQLKELRKIIKKRSDGKEKIIDRRLDQLLQDAEGLGWSSSPHGFSSYRTYFSPNSIPSDLPARP